MNSPEPAPALAEVAETAIRLWAGTGPGSVAVTVRRGDIEVRLESVAPSSLSAPAPPAASVNGSATAPAFPGTPSDLGLTSSPPYAAQAAEAPARTETTRQVRAPLVGVFYRAPAPDEPPFVEVGDIIRKGQQIGIIEAMKTMVPVESDVAGRVAEILAANGEPVEYDRPLLAVTDE